MLAPYQLITPEIIISRIISNDEILAIGIQKTSLEGHNVHFDLGCKVFFLHTYWVCLCYSWLSGPYLTALSWVIKTGKSGDEMPR